MCFYKLILCDIIIKKKVCITRKQKFEKIFKKLKINMKALFLLFLSKRHD